MRSSTSDALLSLADHESRVGDEAPAHIIFYRIPQSAVHRHIRRTIPVFLLDRHFPHGGREPCFGMAEKLCREASATEASRLTDRVNRLRRRDTR